MERVLRQQEDDETRREPPPPDPSIRQPAYVARKYGVAPEVTTSTSRPQTKSQCASGLSYCEAAFLSNRFHSMGHARAVHLKIGNATQRGKPHEQDEDDVAAFRRRRRLPRRVDAIK